MKSFNRRQIADKKHEIELHEIAIDDLKTHKTPLADLLVQKRLIDIQILRIDIQSIIEMDKMSEVLSQIPPRPPHNVQPDPQNTLSVSCASVSSQ
jgi:hypothetical protein